MDAGDVQAGRQARWSLRPPSAGVVPADRLLTATARYPGVGGLLEDRHEARTAECESPGNGFTTCPRGDAATPGHHAVAPYPRGQAAALGERTRCETPTSDPRCISLHSRSICSRTNTGSLASMSHGVTSFLPSRRSVAHSPVGIPRAVCLRSCSSTRRVALRS